MALLPLIRIPYPTRDALLQAIGAQLAANQTQLDTLATWTEAQRQWKPSPYKWSAEECLEHVMHSYNVVAKEAKAALQAAPEATADHPMKSSIAGRLDNWILNNPGKVKAPNLVRPKAEATIPDVLQVYRAHLQNQSDTLAACQHRNLNQTRVPLMVLSWLLKMRLGEFLYITAYHEAHHLKQALRNATLPGFPMA